MLEETCNYINTVTLKRIRVLSASGLKVYYMDDSSKNVQSMGIEDFTARYEKI